MKPEDMATIINMLRDITEKLEEDMKGEFKEATHVDDKQDEIDFQGDTIGALKPGDTDVMLVATLNVKGKIGSFIKKTDNSAGRVQRLVFGDGIGAIAIPLWNDQIDNIGEMVEGRQYDISAYKVEEYPKDSGKLQLVLGKEGHILPAGQEALK